MRNSNENNEHDWKHSGGIKIPVEIAYHGSIECIICTTSDQTKQEKIDYR
jgi:hypothetical protein